MLSQAGVDVAWTTSMMQLVKLGSLEPVRWMVLRTLCSVVLESTTRLSQIVANRQMIQSGGKSEMNMQSGEQTSI
jgi:hypothetical protein